MNNLKNNFIRDNWEFSLFAAILTAKQYIFYVLINFSPFTFPPKTHLVTIPAVTFLILSFSFLFKRKTSRIKYILVFDLFLSLVLLVNTWYFRYFSGAATFFFFYQIQDLVAIKEGFLKNINLSDIIYFIADFPVFIFLLKNREQDIPEVNIKYFRICFSIGLLLFIIKPVRKYFANEEYITYSDPLNNIVALTPALYQVYDLADYFYQHNPVKLSRNDTETINAELAEFAGENQNENDISTVYKNAGKGFNLIIIQAESLENSVINKKYGKKEITPCINNLIRKSAYFPNCFSQISSGNTSDAEFIINTSLYPLFKGCVTYRFPLNKYASLPYLLKKNGYSTLVIHGNRGSFWNRHLVFPSLFFDKFYSVKELKPGENIGLGLSDKDMFNQAIQLLSKQQKPFFAYIITLTSHFPFTVPEKYREFKQPDNKNSMLTDYLNLIHYTDKNIGLFLNYLKSCNLANNTIIVLVGDHDAFEGHYLQNAITENPSWECNRFRNVPLLIYMPQLPGNKIPAYGGQIDILPTLAYIMGIDRKYYGKNYLGKNLFTAKNNIVLLPAKNGIVLPENTPGYEKEKLLKNWKLSDLILRSNYFADNLNP